MNINTLEHYTQFWHANAKNYGINPYHISRFQFVAGLCLPGTTILDVASGPGHISKYLPPGVCYERLDFCDWPLKMYHGVFFVMDVLKTDRLPSPYHTVLAMEILEHLDDPIPLVAKCLDAALYQVIFTVPNNRLPPEICPEHVSVWNRDSFVSFLNPLCEPYRLTSYLTDANIVCQILIGDRVRDQVGDQALTGIN